MNVRTAIVTTRRRGRRVTGSGTCATSYEVSYLLTGLLPPVETICPQNAVPFPSPA